MFSLAAAILFFLLLGCKPWVTLNELEQEKSDNLSTISWQENHRHQREFRNDTANKQAF